MKKKNKPSRKELSDRIEDLRGLVDIQCRSGNWDYDEYMRGMANGLILAMTILDKKRNPKYKNSRKKPKHKK